MVKTDHLDTLTMEFYGYFEPHHFECYKEVKGNNNIYHIQGKLNDEYTLSTLRRVASKRLAGRGVYMAQEVEVRQTHLVKLTVIMD